MSFSVVILSKNFQNACRCIFAVQENERQGRIVLVNDGIEFPEVGSPGWSPNRTRLEWFSIEGQKPFIFSRNANIGIRAAGEDDVILLNDDALLRTPNGFTSLSLVAEMHPEYGVIAASCNNVGNRNQWPQKGDGLREDPRMVCFTCVYIPRRTINSVGLLDERYTGYGCEDDDYCLRVRNAGLKIGIYDGCFVDHSSLKSEFRGHGAGDYRPNLKRFIEKWGVDNWGRPKGVSEFRELFPA